LRLGDIERPREVTGKTGLAPALHPSHAGDRLFGPSSHPIDPDSELLQHGGDDPFLLTEQREKEVHTMDVGVPSTARICRCGLEGLPGAYGQSIEAEHGDPLESVALAASVPNHLSSFKMGARPLNLWVHEGW
jgi:hypothetical protein